MCKSWCEFILAVIILVFALFNWAYSKWVIVIAAIIMIIHSFTCNKCFGGHMMPAKSSGKRRR